MTMQTPCQPASTNDTAREAKRKIIPLYPSAKLRLKKIEIGSPDLGYPLFRHDDIPASSPHRPTVHFVVAHLVSHGGNPARKVFGPRSARINCRSSSPASKSAIVREPLGRKAMVTRSSSERARCAGDAESST